MRKIDCYVAAAIFVLIAFSCGPIVVGGQPVTIGWQVTGSGSQCGTITTGLDWDYIYAHPADDHYWNMQEHHIDPCVIDFGGDNIAYIDGVEIGVKLEGDPYIDFGFAARAGLSNTHFLFTSNLLLVNPALINADGSAWANPSPGYGATILAGDFTDNKIYRAEYNGGTVFADLSQAPIPPGGSNVAPSQSILGQVTSMQTKWGFTLSGNRSQASGTSHFEILGDVIPEPASILLLGLGGLALIRKPRA